VFYVILPDVKDAGDEEKDCEEDRGAFDRSVDPEGVRD
jgi:hypothetical protein